MGTSKSNPGLKPTPLLPPWAPSPPSAPETGGNDEIVGSENGENSQEQPTQQSPVQGDWSNAKAALTTFVRGTSAGQRRRSLKTAGKAYVKGSGGSRRISNSATHGKASIIRLGSILQGFSTNGVEGTFQRFGLGSLDSISIEGAFNKLAEIVCSNGATSEEVIANVATTTALAHLYEQFDLENNDLSNLGNLTNEQISEVIECYITSYVFERWLHELGMSIEGKNIQASEVVAFEREILEFIESTVSLDFEGRDLTTLDLSQGEGKQLIDSVFLQAYQLIETL